MEHKQATLIEWLVPLAFCLVSGWMVWHAPAFILDFGPENGQLAAQFGRTDVTPDMTPIGTFGDIIDYAALILTPIFFLIGVATVRRAPMEFEDWTRLDRVAVFLGRVTMMLVVLLTSVMIYEVVLRYVFERPTLWANEMSLWLAGFVFLCSGLYAMQQRSHIRIFLLYDALPRGLQRTCDVISTSMIVLFAFFLVYGGYGEAFDKFYRWERFGTAFDPPLPATLKPMVLIVVVLVACQAVVNLICDWNAEPTIHTAADDIDEDELEKLRAAVGSSGTDDLDVTRGAIQSRTGGRH
jgi:TRAP-type mannitol/chloroaromatic compound transport system permease small subunit